MIDLASHAEAPGPEALRAALLAGDIGALRKAICAWAEQVRTMKDDEDAYVLADAFESLTSHESGKVRQDVAGAADVVPQDVFDRWLERFGADDDQFVRTAITRAAKKRAARRKTRLRDGTHEKVVADLLSEMETYGKEERRLAERILRRGRETFVRQLHHEAAKTVTPLQYSLVKLRSALGPGASSSIDRADLAHHVEIAWNRLEHLWSVIHNAREATATFAPTFVEAALLPLVQATRAKLAARMCERSGKLAFEVDVDPTLRLDVDGARLLQALENFCQNAAESYAEGAEALHVAVAARSRRAGSEVEITIADRGVGMTEAQRAQLFTPFDSRKPGGTGLGLIIARTMIEEIHGGKLDFASEVGVGTTVTCVLPARQAGRKAGAKS